MTVSSMTPAAIAALALSIVCTGLLVERYVYSGGLTPVQVKASIVPHQDTYWLPCAGLRAPGKITTWNESIAQLLQDRKQRAHVVTDYLELSGHPASALAHTYFQIPRIVHQIWLGPSLPPLVQDWVSGWRTNYTNVCSGWTHMLWMETNISQLNYLNTALYQREPELAGKADVIRAAVLYEFGGIYVDADTRWVNNHCLDHLFELASTTGAFAGSEPSEPYIANGVIAAVKHHPLLQNYMRVQQMFTTYVRVGLATWQRVGPHALTAAIMMGNNVDCTSADDSTTHWLHRLRRTKHLASELYFSTILDEQYFYPTSWHGVNASKPFNTSYFKASYPNAIMMQYGWTTNGRAG